MGLIQYSTVEVTALGECELYSLTHAAIQKCCENHPEAYEYLMKHAGDKLEVHNKARSAFAPARASGPSSEFPVGHQGFKSAARGPSSSQRVMDSTMGDSQTA